MKDPVDHILRPRLPWRDDVKITECGYNAEKVTAISRETFQQRVKDLGTQRASLFTCWTCSQTATRWCTWEDDPRGALQREIEWEGIHGTWYHRTKERGQLLRDELLAIESLIANHREEFEAHVNETAERRAWNERKAALAKAKTAGNG